MQPSAEDGGALEVKKPVDPKVALAAAKVTDFLRHIRGLSTLNTEELDALLHECRYDLIPGLPNSGAENKQRSLPLFSQVPNQSELHDLLTSGQVPMGHQCVAHVLYPESVPWPHESSMTEEDEASGGLQRHGSASPSTSSTGTRRGTGMRSSQHHGSGPLGSNQESTSELDGKSVELSRRSRYTHGASQLDSVDDEAEHCTEVTVRGQRVKTTVRGRPVQEMCEDPLAHNDGEDERYKAARDKRVKCERTAKLERFHERKLLERIEYLEGLKVAEVQHLGALQKRETQRLARNEELKKQLSEGFGRKVEEERLAAEQEAERKKKEAEAEQRTKKYHAKQKELLKEWCMERSDDYISRETQARLRQEELLAQKRAKEKAKESQKKTVKQLEVMERVHRITVAIEERPPLPPKPHDLPRPVLELMDSSRSSASAEKTPRTARGPARSWAAQATAVSNTYGLNDKESAAVKDQLSRGIKGAGRMAEYEKK